jgi:hypothetical protein
MNKLQTTFAGISEWVTSLSERTLTLSAIAILHATFVPNALAFLNGITEKLPNLDAYLLVVLALVIMNLRAILKNDKIASLIHLVGWAGQLSLFALILLK